MTSTYQVVDPATEEPVATVEQFDAAAADAAIERAHVVWVLPGKGSVVGRPDLEGVEMGPLISANR